MRTVSGGSMVVRRFWMMLTAFCLLALVECQRPPSGPEAPWLIAPADATTASAAPVLVWGRVASAEAYQVQVSTSVKFTTLVADTVVADTWLPAAVVADGSYWWRVRSQGPGGVWGGWSEWWSFSLSRFRWLTSATLKGYAQDIEAQGNRLFVAEGQAGISVYEAGGLEPPALLGRATDNQNEAWGICVQDTLVFVAYGYKELAIYSAARPESLQLVGELEYPQPGYGYDVAVKDSFVYIAADAQFIIVNAARPRYPELVFQYRYPRGCRGVAVSEGKCYLALEQNGIEIWDVSSLPPVRLGSLDTPANARGIAVRGTAVFVADGRGGLLVADATDLTRPRVVGTLALTGYAARVAVADTIVLVALGDGGVGIVNATVAERPELAARIRAGNTRGVTANGRYIYGADRDFGIVVIQRED